MDTNTENEVQEAVAHVRHRHLVALPVFALFLALTFLSARVTENAVTADLGLPQGEPRSIVHLPGNIEGVAASGADIADSGAMPELKRGTLLASYPGLFGVSAGDVRCYGFHGGFVLTRTDRELTVAAVTSPVLVMQGAMRMIVPVGLQWSLPQGGQLEPLSSGPAAWSHSRVLSELPPQFLRDQREDLAHLKFSADLPAAITAMPGAEPVISDALLPEARAHVIVDWQNSVIGAVRGAVQKGNAGALKTILDDERYASVFTDEKSIASLALVLGETPSDASELQMLLTERLTSDERLWILLSYHPDFRAVAWTFDRIDLPREPVITRLFFLPFSDMTADAVPSIAFARFTTGFIRVLGVLEQPEPMLKFLFTSYEPMIGRLEALGYPMRSGEFATTLINLMTPYADTYPEAAAAIEHIKMQVTANDAVAIPGDLSADLLRREQERSSSSSSVAASVSSSSVPVQKLSPAEVERRTHILLHSAEAVYTLKTEVKAEAENVAKVSNIVFGAPSGDRTVGFTLNLATEIVSDISVDGKADFPFTPRFESFIRWVKK